MPPYNIHILTAIRRLTEISWSSHKGFEDIFTSQPPLLATKQQHQRNEGNIIAKMFALLGGIAESNFTYCNRRARKCVCLSICHTNGISFCPTALAGCTASLWLESSYQEWINGRACERTGERDKSAVKVCSHQHCVDLVTDISC